MVLNNNNDLSEFFEWIDEGRMSMRDASTALQFGINYAIYALDAQIIAFSFLLFR